MEGRKLGALLGALLGAWTSAPPVPLARECSCSALCKLIRRKKKALNGSNRRAFAEACNDLATFYYKHNRYSDALDEYKAEASICKELGLQMEWGTCNRMIGEMFMLMAEFDKALKYEERHLAIAKELNNLVEEQRAMATLGRIYLLQGQSSSDDGEAKTSLKAAEKAFMKSLVLCEKLNGKINKHELMDMRARLLLNIGVVQEYLGYLEKAIDCINKAISICTSQDLYEVLHNCYTTEALIHCNKKKDYAKALSCLNKALEVASRLEDKKLYEKLGDGACHVKNYAGAAEWYLKMLDHAELAGDEALHYYHKEYDLIKDVPKEAYTTLFNIAETLFLAKKPYDLAKDWNKKKYQIRVLRSLLKYQEEYDETDRMEDTKSELAALGYKDFEGMENSEDEQSSADEEGRASISGNKLLVERLLAKGHPVNVRDNAGWLPLHEACIHGRLEVANLLINHGANMNDRGGSNCDGAIPSLKTDFGETPLDVLQKWRTGTILTKDEEVLYNNICNIIHGLIDKTSATEVLNKTKTPVKNNKTLTPPSTSKVTSAKKFDSPALRRRNIINDDSDDDDINLSQHVRQQLAFPSDDSNDSVDDCKTNDKDKISGVKEYRNAMSALRNRNICDDDDDVVKTTKIKPALLDPDEVDDDWLDDDLGISKSKKRKLTDPLTTVAKKTSYDIKDTIDNLNSINEPLIESNKNPRKKFRVSDLSDNNSSDEQFQRNENVCPRFSPSETTRTSRELNDTLTRDSRQSMRKKWKTQSTLLKAGFQRKRDDIDQSSNSGSDTEFVRKDYSKKLTLSRKNSSENKRHQSGENFSYNSNGIHNDGFNIVQSMNPSIMQSLNVIQPINIVQSKNGRSVQTQILPPAAVKVQVEDKDDPLSLVLSSPELKTCITNWKASPAEERYLECCDAHTTHRLALGSKTLTSTQIRPLFRALTHQTHITAVIISDNNLGDSGIKYLAECICTMKHLTHLDISRNNITHDGTKFILNLFENSKSP
ncbi:Uncharacterized protein OBRU01_23738, partial [Operophtera brumata]